jgi:23S rRNA G2069 N7-methylase RlmK/C1962 C5-methylase RlmI
MKRNDLPIVDFFGDYAVTALVTDGVEEILGSVASACYKEVSAAASWTTKRLRRVHLLTQTMAFYTGGQPREK